MTPDTAVNTATGFVSDVYQMGSFVVDWAVDTAEDVGTGLYDFGSNLVQGNWVDAFGGLVDAGTAILTAPVNLVVGGVALAVHTLVEVPNNLFGLTESRPPNADELAALQAAYPTVDFSNFIIQTGGIQEMIGMRPHVIGNQVFISDEYLTNPAYGAGQVYDSNNNLTVYGETLVHEGGHIHQFQFEGLNYVSDALVAQGLEVVGIGDGYDVGAALQNSTAYEDMNPEQQAEIASLIGIAEHNDPNGNLTLSGFNQAASQAHYPFQVTLYEFNTIVVPAQTQIR